jgi:hypothetical protein
MRMHLGDIFGEFLVVLPKFDEIYFSETSCNGGYENGGYVLGVFCCIGVTGA